MRTYVRALVRLDRTFITSLDLFRSAHRAGIRGDCCRGSGAAEMAVRDYKRALEVEPGNWMVSTRLSLAHYLKVRDDGRLVVAIVHESPVFRDTRPETTSAAALAARSPQASTFHDAQLFTNHAALPLQSRVDGRRNFLNTEPARYVAPQEFLRRCNTSVVFPTSPAIDLH